MTLNRDHRPTGELREQMQQTTAERCDLKSRTSNFLMPAHPNHKPDFSIANQQLSRSNPSHRSQASLLNYLNARATLEAAPPLPGEGRQ